MGTHHDAEMAIVALSIGKSEAWNGLYILNLSLVSLLLTVSINRLTYLTDVNESIFSSVNVNERISWLLSPRLHNSGNIHPARNSVRSTRFLIDYIPQMCTIGTRILTEGVEINFIFCNLILF